MYRTPLLVEPEFELRPTPESYRQTYQGPGKLPDQIKVWRVQNSPRGNMVSPSFGFLDSPDAEIIALGFNLAKEYGAIGIGRQANFLQWGYGDPPSQMTEAGRRLFINCIHYIHRFDGKLPLVRRRANGRDSALYVASVLRRLYTEVSQHTYLSPRREQESVFYMFGRDPSPPDATPRTIQVPREVAARTFAQQNRFAREMFASDLWEKCCADPEGFVTCCKANLELVYWDGVFRVDEELRSLGLDSNRKVATLERLFELREDPARREIAQRLLDRYTDGQTQFDFQNGRDRIYFSDVGGYKFSVVPEAYLLGPNERTPTSPSASR